MSFLSNGTCLAWARHPVAAMAGADAISAIALLSIIPAIAHGVRRRHDSRLEGMAWLAGACIVVCVLAQIMAVWMLWRADFAAQVLTNGAMALISCASALAVWRLLPRVEVEARTKPESGRLTAGGQRQRFAMEAARVGEWELDLITGVALHSEIAAKCLGIDPSADWSMAAFFEAIHPDDRERVSHAFTAEVVGAKNWSVECRVFWPDGTLHWIASHGSVHAEDGAFRLMRGVVFDITAQKQAESSRVEVERLENENRQILEASRLKNQFLANMSHELRTPLSSIIGFAELLHSGAVPGDSPKHSEFLGYIADSGHHLLRLINDILDISKVEAGAFEFSPEPLRLTAMVDDVIEILQPVITQKQLSIACDIDTTVDHVALDRSRLKQVLYNFVSNAINFSHHGGHIAIRAMPEGAEKFRVEVEDHGIGIAQSDLSKLFDEFEQLDAALGRREGGAGLGLALTRRLIDAQGGSVGVSSVHGRGTSFHFILSRRHGFP